MPKKHPFNNSDNTEFIQNGINHSTPQKEIELVPTPPEEEGKSASEQTQKDMEEQIVDAKEEIEETAENIANRLKKADIIEDKEKYKDHVSQFLTKISKRDIINEQKAKDDGSEIGPSR